MNIERIMVTLLVTLPVAFAAGYTVGAYPKAEPTSLYPANYDPARADAMATVRAQQDSLAKCYAAITEMAAKNVSH